MARLSLPTLFAVALFTVVNCDSVGRAEDAEAHAIALAEEFGGSAKVNSKLDEIARVEVKLPAATDAVLKRLCKMPSIGALEVLDATKCTEVGFGCLKELPDLQTLVLGKCPINDKEAIAIGGLRTLNVLFVGESKLTDVTFAQFKKLVNLKTLDVSDCAITDKSAAVLIGLKKLEELNLSKTKFGDPGVTALKNLEKLRLLKLNQSNVTRKGIDAIEAARARATLGEISLAMEDAFGRAEQCGQIAANARVVASARFHCAVARGIGVSHKSKYRAD